VLYVTTRNDQEVYTAQRALREGRGPDGGFYVPFRDPVFSEEDICALKEKSFNRCVAEVLNVLFQTRLSSWDVDFAIGRYAVRLQMLGKRLIVSEGWHNLESDFSRIVNNLSALLQGEKSVETCPGGWVEIGIRIAVLFGIFGELMREGITDGNQKVDVSVVSGDFSAPMSAWYARKWGLPIGNIVCACNENSNLWDFICHGTLRCGDVALSTDTPHADVIVPEGLERLIHACAGTGETERYLDTVRKGETYYAEDLLLHRLRKGIYVTVSSGSRVRSTIPTVFATHSYVLSPYGALAYAGLQDYRARTGESRTALLLEERSPLLEEDTVSSALGITADALKEYLK
jgi:threonine synthase